MLIKICGITSVEDAKFALGAGADWIGLNLVGGPRRIDLAAVRAIIERMEEPARAVALLSTEPEQAFESTWLELRAAGIIHLQIYGRVTAAKIQRLARQGVRVIYVQPVAGEEDLRTLDSFLKECRDAPPSFVLFDAHVPGRAGGTGQIANWDVLAEACHVGRPPVILAGGLTAANVAQAIARIAPAGVDVSSGVESAPGKKDHRKIAEFIASVRLRK